MALADSITDGTTSRRSGPLCEEPKPAAEPAPAPEPPASTAVAERPATTPRKTPPKQLPPYRVLLHNDDHNSMEHVVDTIVELTPLAQTRAVLSMLEAHSRGVSLLLVTHKERAELYQEQFHSKGLTVTIEPAE